MSQQVHCADCESSDARRLSRRRFVKTVGATSAAATLTSASAAHAALKPSPKSTSENLVEKLFRSLTPSQREVVCFDWDYTDKRGLLRLFVANNWHITKPVIGGDFFTADQRDLIEAIFWGLYNPEWKDRIKKQLEDDAGGYGKRQNIAIFGEPGTGEFEFVMTGRHLTIRCDGNSTEHTAFGGPIFYGHASRDSPDSFNEQPDHPGNVFWYQALKANKLYGMLDGRQRKLGLVPDAPPEEDVHFRGPVKRYPGIPVTELSADQKEHLQGVLQALIDPYRRSDRDEVITCLKTQGGLDRCSIAFFESDDVGNDRVWDTWRLEGPSFVWHFRGDPHVHVWVNVADDSGVRIST